MELFINWAVLLTAIWLISMSLITNTKDFNSGLVFKVIPMLLGLSCLFSAIKLFGWM